MSRYASYLRALATGYGLLAANIAYSLALVPMALSELGAKTFGLWALTMQIGAIAQLADAGMSGALNRIIVEYKDDKTSADYRQIFYTMWLAFSLIGVALVLSIWSMTPFLTRLLAIPVEFRPMYGDFLAAYGLLLGLSFSIKPFTMLPFAHQRSDLLNLISIGGLLASFLTLWYGLRHDWGLWSLLAGMAVSQCLIFLAVLGICFRLHLFPRPSTQRKLSLRAFREVFDYGKDRLLITLGFTALQAAPTFLITRLLGLEANATWSVASRMAQLCQQLIGKICDLSYPALAEMFVRGEHVVLRKRYANLLAIGFGIGLLGAAGIAACNRDFVALWTSGRIQSSSLLDALLALWLLTTILQRFLFVPASIARDIKDIRPIYLMESLLVCIMGYLMLGWFGELWIMAAILPVASLWVTIPRNAFKSSRLLETTCAQLLAPLASLSFRVLLPSLALVALARALPGATGWLWLTAKAAVITAAMAMLLAWLPELRNPAIELLRRIRPQTAA